MGDKHRDLPSWMVAKDAKRREQGELGKSVQTRDKRKKTTVQRETLYFMNEIELVDAALRVLSEGGGGNPGTGILAQQTEAEKKTRGWMVKTNGNFIKRKTTLIFESDTDAESSDCELSKKTYISETDSEDLAEKATLPYAAEEPANRGLSSVSDRDQELVRPSCSVATEPDQGNASPENSDDDALRLVREIFFS